MHGFVREVGKHVHDHVRHMQCVHTKHISVKKYKLTASLVDNNISDMQGLV